MKSFERLALAAAVGLSLIAYMRSGAVAPAMAEPLGADAPVKIAVCSTVRIVDELMDSDRYKPARVEVEDALRKEKLEPIISEGRDLQKTLEDLPRDDPKYSATREQLLRLQREAERASREIAQKVEAKVSEQLIECYGLVRGSAAAVAEQHGYTYVLSSGDADDTPKGQMVVQLVRDFLSRPVLIAPDGTDISDDVRQDLKLQ